MDKTGVFVLVCFILGLLNIVKYLVIGLMYVTKWLF